ncbi:hypothetical protein QFC22_005555 [Naganishia vaughanmartiniae]|uniref:Uncharacterized protein n=1 Tax=Naganishia vaughanmartiniae TaxID=1424756 RepID=A0ACC2WU26_9TREE|nr:hypothetical protein QFC22_005555 [Naganishia vaughanmartiniae]
MTIASCAGDSQILVYDVERLDRLIAGGLRSRLGELNGMNGPGVRRLLCHRDRVKRISTEASNPFTCDDFTLTNDNFVQDNPHVFLTVSEDGTVRQHDLRTTHNCRSGCPAPLMTTLSSIQLYSLSVSKINPYIFTVAGTAPYAFLQDRRMVRPMKEEWAKGTFTSGGEADQGGKVHCVRRFGLDRNAEEEDDHSAGDGDVPEEERVRRREAARRRWHMVRHITAVDMSEHNAEDLIVSFSGHSVALFSIHDDPSQTSIRSVRPRNSPIPNTSTPVRGKRRRGSSGASRLQRARHTTQNGDETRHRESDTSAEASPMIGPRHDTPVQVELEERPDADSEATQQSVEKQDRAAPQPSDATSTSLRHATPVPPPPTHVYGAGISARDLLASPQLPRPRTNGNDTVAPVDTMVEEGIQTHHGDEARQDGNMDDGQDDDDDNDPDDDEEMDSADEEELEAILADEEEGLYPAEDESASPFSTAPVVYPRRLFKGARNVETVKDVTFLGAMSDKIGSGSDDGNFFVWDKATGKLEGIWEGDSSVVNVIEQHPSLPLCAVSGIDSTVKLFAPLHKHPARSYERIGNAENIVRANTQSDRSRGIGGRMALLSSYARFLAQGGGGLEEAGEDGEGIRDCALQ